MAQPPRSMVLAGNAIGQRLAVTTTAVVRLADRAREQGRANLRGSTSKANTEARVGK